MKTMGESWAESWAERLRDKEVSSYSPEFNSWWEEFTRHSSLKGTWGLSEDKRHAWKGWQAGRAMGKI